MTNLAKHHLMVMRHAKADRPGELRDFDRPLTERGRQDALCIGRWMNEHGRQPAILISSPARRTRETSLIVATELGLKPDQIRWITGIYQATLDDLINVLHEQPIAAGLLLVGHNPGMDALVGWLASSKPARTARGKLMTTASLAVFAPGAVPLNRHSMQLERLLRPKEIN